MKAIISDSPSRYTVRLERKLMEKWLHNGKTAEDMIVLLDIGNGGYCAVGGPRVHVLTKYVGMKGEVVPAILKWIAGTISPSIKWHGQHVKVGDDIFRKVAITRDAERGRALEDSYQDFEEEKEMGADLVKSYERFEYEEHDLADLHVYEHLPSSPRRK